MQLRAIVSNVFALMLLLKDLPFKSILADEPWDHLQIDFIGLLPISYNYFEYILTVVDVCTIVHFLCKKNAVTVATALGTFSLILVLLRFYNLIVVLNLSISFCKPLLLFMAFNLNLVLITILRQMDLWNTTTNKLDLL